MTNCPKCSSTNHRVIYYGLPCYLCSYGCCSTISGFWSYPLSFLPFNGIMYAYEGSYWKALKFWLLNDKVGL